MLKGMLSQHIQMFCLNYIGKKSCVLQLKTLKYTEVKLYPLKSHSQSDGKASS